MSNSTIEILSQTDAGDFPAHWYEVADDEHFWVKARFDFLQREISSVGLDINKPAIGLDIGCGHGVVQRQLNARTGWVVDGCDVNSSALEQNWGHRGRILLYNIHDRNPSLYERYDFLVLFDVIEHIERVSEFLGSAMYHLKPGGFALINVPALSSLFSKYDIVAGHIRRYDRKSLEDHLTSGGLKICSMRYWGLSMMPIGIVRKWYLALKQDPAAILEAGFQPPARLFAWLQYAALSVELRTLLNAPIGTSLLAIARKT